MTALNAVSTGVSNILDIEVPAAMRQWLSTGIPWFDMALGGRGMKRSQVLGLFGGAGAGKSTMAQMLADSLVGLGHNVLYNINEEYLFQVKLRCEELGLSNGFAADSITDPKALTDRCDTLMASRPGVPFFLIQDSLQTLNDGKWGDDVNSKTPVRCLAHLFNWCKSTGAVMIAVNHVTKGGQFAGSNKLRHMTDSFGGLVVDHRPKSPTLGKRLLAFEKNRMGGCADPVILEMDDAMGGLLVQRGIAFDSELDDSE